MSTPKVSTRNPDTSTFSVQTSTQLTQIARCLGFLVLNAYDLKNKPNSDLIPFLKRIGFGAGDIADMLDTTVNTVNKELSIAKAAKKEKTVKGKRVKSNGKDQSTTLA